VTGGLGLIESKLISYLLSKGFNITLVNNTKIRLFLPKEQIKINLIGYELIE
jgi:hypothetical protein